MRIRWPGLVILVVVATGVVGVLGVRFAGSQDQQDYAVRVNGKLFTATDVARVQEANRRVATAAASQTNRDPASTVEPVDGSSSPRTNSDQSVVAEQLVEDELFAEEAKRRGLTCSDPEAASNLRDQVNIGGDAAILAVVASGLAPAGYLDTPAAQRSPSADALIAGYLADKQVLAEAKHQCEVSKLYSVLGARDANGGLNNDVRNKAIADLKAELIAKASIDRKPGYFATVLAGGSPTARTIDSATATAIPPPR